MKKILTTPRSYGRDMPELFAQLEAAGYAVVKNTTGGILDKEQMKALIADCVGVIVGVDPLDAEVLSCAPKLRAISKYGVGMDNIDLDVCKARGIRVSRAVGANSEAVADYAVALMLAVARRVPAIDRKCRQLDWGKITTRDVSHATLGLFGLGAIGKFVARRAKGFDMKVMAYDPYWPEEFARENGIERADAETIFRNADFISLHLPLMPETEGFVGERELSMMKKRIGGREGAAEGPSGEPHLRGGAGRLCPRAARGRRLVYPGQRGPRLTLRRVHHGRHAEHGPHRHGQSASRPKRRITHEVHHRA